MSHFVLRSLVVLSVFSVAKARALPTCDEQFTAAMKPAWTAPKACADYNQGLSAAYRRFDDGTVIPNQRLTQAADLGPPTAEIFKETGNLVRMTKASPSQADVVGKFAASLRSELVDQIKQGVSEASLSPVQNHLIKRVNAMVIRRGETTGDCERLTPQAAYDASSNTLRVCATLMNYPTEALLPILSHEMGHAVDPCVLEGFIVPRDRALKSEQGRIKAFRKCGLPKENEASNSERLKALMAISSKVIDVSEASAFAHFARCEFMKRESSGLREADLAASPYADAFTCVDKLSRKNGETMSSLFGKMANVGLSEADRAKAGPIDLGLSQNFNCSIKAREMYADRVGAKLTASYIAHHRAALSESKIKEMLYDLSYDVCARRRESLNYTDPNDRMRVFLEYPEIQTSVGCKGLTTPPLCPGAALSGGVDGGRVAPPVR